MTITLAAVGAVLAALLEVTLWPYVDVAGGHPHLVFVYALAWTLVGGFDGGMSAAVAGGLSLDVLASRPLGVTAFALLLVVGAAAVLARGLSQLELRYVAPLVTTFVLSFAFSLIVVVAVNAIQHSGTLVDPFRSLLAGAILDTVVAAAVSWLALAVRARRDEHDRLAW